ncbi:MAG: hypothetical protein NTX93_10980 [Bacteroidia bacterium]|nr:hypothetical protein [Bacteroidia bacterium]
MKKMNKTERFTDKEWEKLASLLSDEKSEETDLLSRFMVEDTCNTGKQWKELKDMSSEKEINVDKAWNSVYSRLNEDGLKTNNGPARISFMRSTFMRVAATVVILLTLGTTTVYLNYTGTFSKKITVATDNDQN